MPLASGRTHLAFALCCPFSPCCAHTLSLKIRKQILWIWNTANQSPQESFTTKYSHVHHMSVLFIYCIWFIYFLYTHKYLTYVMAASVSNGGRKTGSVQQKTTTIWTLTFPHTAGKKTCKRWTWTCTVSMWYALKTVLTFPEDKTTRKQFINTRVAVCDMYLSINLIIYCIYSTRIPPD